MHRAHTHTQDDPPSVPGSWNDQGVGPPTDDPSLELAYNTSHVGHRLTSPRPSRSRRRCNSPRLLWDVSKRDGGRGRRELWTPSPGLSPLRHHEGLGRDGRFRCALSDRMSPPPSLTSLTLCVLLKDFHAPSFTVVLSPLVTDLSSR